MVITRAGTRGSLVPALTTVSLPPAALGDHFRGSEHEWRLAQPGAAPAASLACVPDQPPGAVRGAEQKAAGHSRLQRRAVWVFDCKSWSCLNEKLSEYFVIFVVVVTFQRTLFANNDQGLLAPK